MLSILFFDAKVRLGIGMTTASWNTLSFFITLIANQSMLAMGVLVAITVAFSARVAGGAIVLSFIFCLVSTFVTILCFCLGFCRLGVLFILFLDAKVRFRIGMAAAARNALSFLFSMVANQSVLAIGVLVAITVAFSTRMTRGAVVFSLICRSVRAIATFRLGFGLRISGIRIRILLFDAKVRLGIGGRSSAASWNALFLLSLVAVESRLAVRVLIAISFTFITLVM
jgi:hypothetical protein